ncbi:MAG: hypothetical protein ACYTXE_38145 [Nostoc sp.]
MKQPRHGVGDRWVWSGCDRYQKTLERGYRSYAWGKYESITLLTFLVSLSIF